MQNTKPNTSLDIPKNIDSNITYNTPVIFKKKINKLIFKPLQYISNDTGLMRHYPPGAQE
jgi:hypothetical protein